ncbi:MAG: PilZ domain-containing protein [Nitrospira sp.]|nr:PilZ domain-containing protein [Nitrospira sp.]MCP9442517.1 PilZ domain-containing protein [Nitrospira sp.]
MAQRMSASDLYQRGLVLKKAHMFHMAIEDFEQAARDPQYAPQAYIQMALCWRAVDRADEAVAAFRRAAASPILSSEERMHVLYHMGRLLEEQGRFSESLELYGVIRKESPDFGDVALRIKRLCSGERRSMTVTRGSRSIRRATSSSWGLWVKSFFQQTGRWLDRTSQAMPEPSVSRLGHPRNQGRGASELHSFSGPHEGAEADQALKKRTVEHRRCKRVPIRLPSSFAAKGRMVAGKGEVCDLSPWGCRISSAVSVPIGTDMQCCIFSGRSGDALMIEGATVRWIGPREFGLAFTKISPAVQEQLVRLCGVAA